MLTITNIRPLEQDDYNKGYLDLLQQGFTITPSTVSFEEFTRFLNDTRKQTLIIESKRFDIPDELINVVKPIQIVASTTIIVEEKLIHNMGKVCHIEDVVVDKDSRGKGFGKQLIQHCVELAKTYGCYKCILNCDEANVKFYEKCDTGFECKGVEMAAYL